MKNLHFNPSPFPLQFLHFLGLQICCLCFCFSTLQSQSLYDIAINLDSLYSKLHEDKTAAQPFFDELKKIYVSEEAIEAKDIANDVSGNHYLAEKVRIALGQLGILEDNSQNLVSEMTTQKDSLFVKAIKEVESFCSRDCSFKNEFDELKASPSIKNLSKLRKKIEANDLKEKIKQIEQAIISLELNIEKAANASEAVFIQSAKSANLIPFSSTELVPALPPIILQQAGSTSAESAIIDGTSRWVAERMRQELSIAFFDRFETWAEGENIRSLFPNTFSMLQASAPPDYNLMIKIFKTAFEKDLNHLTFNLANFLEGELVDTTEILQLERDIAQAYYDYDFSTIKDEEILSEMTILENLNYEPIDIEEHKRDLDTTLIKLNKSTIETLFFEKLSQWEQNDQSFDKTISDISKNSKTLHKIHKVLKYVQLTLTIIEQLNEGKHPTAVLNFVTEHIDELFVNGEHLKPTLLTLNVLSQSLMAIDNQTNTVWRKHQDLEELRNSVQFRQFYFGLIYQKIKQKIREGRTILEGQKTKLLGEDIVYQNSLSELEKLEAFGNLTNELLSIFRAELLINAEKPSFFVLENILDTYKPNYSYFSAFNKTGKLSNNHILRSEDVEMLIKEHKTILNYAVYIYLNRIAENKELDSLINVETYQKAMEQLNRDWEDSLEEVKQVAGVDDFVNREFIINIKKRELNNLNFDGTYQGSPLASQFNIREYFFEHYIKDEKLIDKYVQQFEEDFWQRRLAIRQQENLAAVNAILQQIEDEVMESCVLPYLKYKKSSLELEVIAENKAVQQINLELEKLNQHQQFIDQILLKDQRGFGEILNQFLQFTSKMDYIHEEFKNLRTKDKTNLGNQEFVYLLKNSLDMLDLIFEIALPHDQKTVTKVKNMTTSLLDAHTAVLEEDYEALVMNIMPVAELLLEESYNGKIKELTIEAAASDSTATRLGLSPRSPALDSLLEIRDMKLRKLREVFKYSTFLAAVVESKDAEEIKNAIEAIALPIGSYSIKRRTFRNISLNAYPGVTGGMELAKNTVISEWAPNFGFTAPIGIAVSWGYKTKINEKKYRNKLKYQRKVQKAELTKDDKFLAGQSGSLFFPLIDLGAVVLFRLQNEEDPLPEDIGFKQIFSPGLMYVHGLPSVPISIMGGMQMSPQLRTIDERKANSFRFNLSVVVDLPIANFYTRKREKS